MKKYKWGILGCGQIAQKFAGALQRLEQAEIFAVASSDSSRAIDFGQRFGAHKSFGSYKEMLSDPEVEIVYVATPHSHHFLHSKMCLESGKAVICEKPFTIDAGELRELIALAKEKDLFLMEALWTRFLPHIIKAKELVDQGAIGELKMVSADFGFKADFIPERRLFNPDLGGGALLDIGIYPVFLAYLFLGYPEKVRALSTFGPTGVDEQTAMTLVHQGNTISELSCTLLSRTRQEATLYGTTGNIRMARRWYGPSEIELFRDDISEMQLDYRYDDNGFEYEALEVMRCLDAGLKESPVWTPGNSLDLMRMLDEIRFSSGITYNNRIR